MLTKRKKASVIKKVQRHDTDTGSPEAQIAVLTRKIEEVTTHLKTHKKDNHSRRGLMQMVQDRRAHLKYLQGKDSKAHKKVTTTLGLRG